MPMRLFNELGVDLRRMRRDLLAALEVPEETRKIYLRQRETYEQAHRQVRDNELGPSARASDSCG